MIIMKGDHTDLKSFVVLTACSFGLTILSFLFLSAPSTLADTDVVTSTAITIEESCTLSGITDTDHTADLVNGTYSGSTYSNGIGQTTLKTFCNDDAGYAIYAIGYTNDEYGNTTMHWNKASSLNDSTNAINTGVYVSGTTTSSTWSMKLASVSGTYTTIIDDGNSSNNNSTEDFTNWHVIPSEYKRVAYSTSGTDLNIDGSGIGSSITVTYDTFVSTAQPAGSYTGQVKYTLVHPNNEDAPMSPLDPSVVPNNAIVYAPNTNDIIGSMSSLPQTTTTLTNASPQAGAISATTSSNYTGTTILIAPNYKREGYGFVGWSTSFDATTADNPTIYGPNEAISIDPNNGGVDTTNGLVLYPVWIESSGEFQSWHGCASLTPVSYDAEADTLFASLDSVIALTDTRDGNVYTVARLADDNCWMVENLRLNAEDSRGTENMYKAEGYGTSAVYGDFIGLADSEDTLLSNSTANSLYSTDGSNGTINVGTNNYPQYRIPRYNGNNTNMAVGATNSVGTTLEDTYNALTDHSRWYSYGNYYNWPAAIADTGYYYINASASTSICPAGWYLPSSYQYQQLDLVVGGTGNAQSQKARFFSMFPNNFVYNHSGSVGTYWTVFSSDYDIASNLNISSSPSHVYPGVNVDDKSLGASVRCIFLYDE